MTGLAVAAAVGLTLVIGAVATVIRAHVMQRRAEAEAPPEGRFVAVDGLKIHYVQAGKGPDLVLIHGASGNARDFTEFLMPMLTGRFRVTAFDRPGFGYSDRAKHASIADQARILAHAADRMGLKHPLVLGQSYGGAVALAWAVAHRDTAGLVLISAVSNPWTTGIGAYYSILSSAFGQAILAPLIAAWLPKRMIDGALREIFAPDIPPDGYAETIGARLSLRLPSLRENALERRKLLSEVSAQVVHYPELTLPAEILHGTEDRLVSARIHSQPLSRQLPNADLRLLDGIGHMPHHAARGEVIAAIDRAATRAGLL